MEQGKFLPAAEICRAMLQWNNSPHKDGLSPAMKMFGRPVVDADSIDVLAGKYREHMSWWQERQARRARIKKEQTLVNLRKSRELSPLAPGAKLAVCQNPKDKFVKFGIFGEVLGADANNETYYVIDVNGKLVQANRMDIRV